MVDNPEFTATELAEMQARDAYTKFIEMKDYKIDISLSGRELREISRVYL